MCTKYLSHSVTCQVHLFFIFINNSLTVIKKQKIYIIIGIIKYMITNNCRVN